jgi:hypothetical protein
LYPSQNRSSPLADQRASGSYGEARQILRT